MTFPETVGAPSDVGVRVARQRGGPSRALPAMCCFDFDGLIADTATLWTRAFTQACLSSGGVVDRINVAELHGASVSAAAAVLSAQLGVDVDDEQLLDALMNGFRATPPNALPGVAMLLSTLAGAARMMVVTNGPCSLVEETLTTLGLRHHFDKVVGAEHVDRPKPAPDVYLAACRAAGVRPAAAVAFEDSAIGARSALSAGLRVVGVPGDGTVSLPADLVVKSLNDPQLLTYLGLP